MAKFSSSGLPLYYNFFLKLYGLGFSLSLDSHALLVPWSPSFHFSLSTSILSTTYAPILSRTYASVGGCYHYSKVDLSNLVELTLLRILITSNFLEGSHSPPSNNVLSNFLFHFSASENNSESRNGKAMYQVLHMRDNIVPDFYEG